MDANLIEIGAAQIACHLAGAGQNSVTVQFVIKDHSPKYLLVSPSASTAELAVRWEKASNADVSLYLSTSDLKDVHDHGYVRNYVGLTGPTSLVECFRRKYMSISHAGKLAIEAASEAKPGPQNVDSISLGTLGRTEFYAKYAIKSVPVIITDAMPIWRAMKWSKADLVREFGNFRAQIRNGDYTTNIYQASMERGESTIGDFISSCNGRDEAPSQASGPPPYAASNIVPSEWFGRFDLPPFVPNNLCGFSKFWLGPGGTITPLHRDWSDNFLMQLLGRKSVALYSPMHATIFKPTTIHTQLDSCPWINPYNKSEGATPLFLALQPGEMLFLPAGWFHDVRAVEFSFSINYFLRRVPYATLSPSEME